MEETELKELTNEELTKKEKSLKAIFGILTVATTLLLVFTIVDSLDGGDFEMSLMIIAICSIGGGVSIYPQLKSIQQEKSRREEL
jgi:hypothetical protein